MKKTVIANWGSANQGKSDTIKRVARLLLHHYPGALYSPSDLTFDEDILAIILIKKLKIGIESQGDPGRRLGKSLDYFIEQNCDIILCSCRTRGSTMEDVDSLSDPKYGYDVMWVTNFRSRQKDQIIMNQLSAEGIVKLIMQLIDNKI